MVDVGAKAMTRRIAVAEGFIQMREATWQLVRQGNHRKGDVLGVARIAAIQAAKRTADLIPLCHPVPLTRVDVQLQALAPNEGDFDAADHEPIDAKFRANHRANHRVRCRVRVECIARTGVEIEALAAVQIGLLTVYDMCKAVDRSMRIDGVRVLEKRGGRSGDWVMQADGTLAAGNAA